MQLVRMYYVLDADKPTEMAPVDAVTNARKFPDQYRDRPWSEAEVAAYQRKVAKLAAVE